MMTAWHRVTGLAAVIVCAALPGIASAAPEEIQVYRDEIESPGHWGLDIHTNYVLSASSAADEPGLAPSLHRLRVTPEFAYALSDAFELGLYLPLASLQTDSGKFRVEGIKARLKYIAPRVEGQAWYWGLNGEIGRVDATLDPNPYNAEIKAILGTRRGPWSLTANFNVDMKVRGPESAPTTVELATKIEYDLGGDVQVGIENFNGLGEWHRLGGISRSEHQSFLTLARKLGPVDLDLGIGAGYGSNPDHLLIKAIFGVPLH